MKVNIWIKKEDVKSGTITEHHTHLPQVGYVNYVQVSISTDEFIQLEDNKTAKFTKEFGFQTDTDCNYTIDVSK
jgi:hypothetical protein